MEHLRSNTTFSQEHEGLIYIAVRRPSGPRRRFKHRWLFMAAVVGSGLGPDLDMSIGAAAVPWRIRHAAITHFTKIDAKQEEKQQ